MQAHKDVLASLDARGRLRSLTGQSGLDLTSNDYLGLADSPALKEAVSAALARGVPVGAGGSRLLRGNHPEHEMLEAEAAEFFGHETALYFPTGFAANAAIAATLPRRGDLIVFDALMHASFRDGLEPARIAAVMAAHNDVNDMEAKIRAWRVDGGKGQVWIAVETLYGMDGDRAPLSDLAALADRHDAMLLLDEAHATGVFGPGGCGLGASLEGRENVISLHTCGKALGVAGGLVCCSALMRDFLINRGRSFIYSTAPSPLVAAAVRAALKLCEAADVERAALARLVAEADAHIKSKLGRSGSDSQVQPIIIGEDQKAVSVAAAMQAKGYDIRAIRPPTVPEGTARLRLSLSLHVDSAALEKMFGELADVIA